MSYSLVLQRPGGSGEVNNPAHYSLYKVRLCKYYMQYGHCIWGASCLFAHGEKDLRTFRETSRNLAEPRETLEDVGWLLQPKCVLFHRVKCVELVY